MSDKWKNISEETINEAHKPFDVVTNKKGDVGYIKEVNLNDCQTEIRWQRSYHVKWLVGDEFKVAWFEHEELEVYFNLLISIPRIVTGKH